MTRLVSDGRKGFERLEVPAAFLGVETFRKFNSTIRAALMRDIRKKRTCLRSSRTQAGFPVLPLSSKASKTDENERAAFVGEMESIMESTTWPKGE